MSKKFGQALPQIVDYATKLCQPEDAFLKDIRKRADAAKIPAVHVGAFDGRHLEILVALNGAKKVVEIGTLAGYSGIHILRGMGPHGHLYTFEYAPHHAAVAEETFRLAGCEDQVSLFVGPALKNLSKIETSGPFDIVFIDADKKHYTSYLAWAEKNLRVGGAIIADNTFGWNMIADEVIPDREDRISVEGLRKFNEALASNPNFRLTMLPTEEGMTVAIKNAGFAG